MKKGNLVVHFYAAFLFFFFNHNIVAQVPVSEEPMHPPVVQNKYIRLLDVRLKAGDTTQFHIHSTPSVFVVLNGAINSTQIKGEDWTKTLTPTGTIWYRSFSPDILVHRVANSDIVTFHVNDIEILSTYSKNNSSPLTLLPFNVLFENDKVVGYQITNDTFNKQIIKGRGPMVAAVVTGNGIYFYDTVTKQSKELPAGGHLYIAPETSFYFSATGTGEIKIALFEIK